MVTPVAPAQTLNSLHCVALRPAGLSALSSGWFLCFCSQGDVPTPAWPPALGPRRPAAPGQAQTPAVPTPLSPAHPAPQDIGLSPFSDCAGTSRFPPRSGRSPRCLGRAPRGPGLCQLRAVSRPRWGGARDPGGTPDGPRRADLGGGRHRARGGLPVTGCGAPAEHSSRSGRSCGPLPAPLTGCGAAAEPSGRPGGPSPCSPGTSHLLEGDYAVNTPESPGRAGSPLGRGRGLGVGGEAGGAGCSPGDSRGPGRAADEDSQCNWDGCVGTPSGVLFAEGGLGPAGRLLPTPIHTRRLPPACGRARTAALLPRRP